MAGRQVVTPPDVAPPVEAPPVVTPPVTTPPAGGLPLAVPAVAPGVGVVVFGCSCGGVALLSHHGTTIAQLACGLAGPPFGPIGQASNVTLEGNREQGPLPCPSGTGAGIFLLGAPHSTVRDNTFSGLNGAAIVSAAIASG